MKRLFGSHSGGSGEKKKKPKELQKTKRTNEEEHKKGQSPLKGSPLQRLHLRVSTSESKRKNKDSSKNHYSREDEDTDADGDFEARGADELGFALVKEPSRNVRSDTVPAGLHHNRSFDGRVKGSGSFSDHSGSGLTTRTAASGAGGGGVNANGSGAGHPREAPRLAGSFRATTSGSVAAADHTASATAMRDASELRNGASGCWHLPWTQRRVQLCRYCQRPLQPAIGEDESSSHFDDVDSDADSDMDNDAYCHCACPDPGPTPPAFAGSPADPASPLGSVSGRSATTRPAPVVVVVQHGSAPRLAGVIAEESSDSEDERCLCGGGGDSSDDEGRAQHPRPRLSLVSPLRTFAPAPAIPSATHLPAVHADPNVEEWLRNQE